MWCSHCVVDREVVSVPNQDYFACSFCGKILEYPVYKTHRMIGKPKKSQGLHGRAGNLGSLFDIDDLEVARYLYNEKEKRLRKIIWEEMHKEYLEVQAAKKAAAAAAAEGACQARLANDSEESLSAQELATLTAAALHLKALAKSRKEKKQNHPPKSRSSTSAKSCGGTYHELKRKSLSSKINYEVLESLYKDNTKKQRTASETGECGNDEIKTIEETHKESEESAVNNAKDSINVDGDNGDDDHYNNEDDEYYGNAEDDYYEQPDEEYGNDEWDP